MKKNKQIELMELKLSELHHYLYKQGSHGDDFQLRFGYKEGGEMVCFLYHHRLRRAFLLKEEPSLVAIPARPVFEPKEES